MATARSHSRSTWIRTGVVALLMLALAGGFAYWQITSQRVYIDTATVEAPQIDLAPSAPGILQYVYVREGDVVDANTTVARVGNELIKSKVAGLVISIDEKIGAQVNPNQAVVTMIDPMALRIVGKLDEDKGLDRIQVGDPVQFTVDAFGARTFSGVVDEISPTSEQSGVVFNISDKREVKQFEVKARFDINAYTDLKNGMSARMWVFMQ